MLLKARPSDSPPKVEETAAEEAHHQGLAVISKGEKGNSDSAEAAKQTEEEDTALQETRGPRGQHQQFEVRR